jgi:hypothetical protein
MKTGDCAVYRIVIRNLDPLSATVVSTRLKKGKFVPSGLLFVQIDDVQDEKVKRVSLHVSRMFTIWRGDHERANMAM